MIKIIKERYKILISVSFIVLGFLSALIIFFYQPIKKQFKPIYNEKEEFLKTKIVFPVEQHIQVTDDYLNGVWLYLEDDSLNQYDYTVELFDKNGNSYFKHDFNDYTSNIIYMEIKKIEKAKNMDLMLKISCNQCENVTTSIGKSSKSKTYLENTKNDSLKIILQSETKNYSYYWYSILFFVLGLILLPLAKEEENEKVK